MYFTVLLLPVLISADLVDFYLWFIHRKFGKNNPTHGIVSVLRKGFSFFAYQLQWWSNHTAGSFLNYSHYHHDLQYFYFNRAFPLPPLLYNITDVLISHLLIFTFSRCGHSSQFQPNSFFSRSNLQPNLIFLCQRNFTPLQLLNVESLSIVCFLFQAF